LADLAIWTLSSPAGQRRARPGQSLSGTSYEKRGNFNQAIALCSWCARSIQRCRGPQQGEGPRRQRHHCQGPLPAGAARRRAGDESVAIPVRSNVAPSASARRLAAPAGSGPWQWWRWRRGPSPCCGPRHRLDRLAHQLPQGDRLVEVAALLVKDVPEAIDLGVLALTCRACSKVQMARSPTPVPETPRPWRGGWARPRIAHEICSPCSSILSQLPARWALRRRSFWLRLVKNDSFGRVVIAVLVLGGLRAPGDRRDWRVEHAAVQEQRQGVIVITLGEHLISAFVLTAAARRCSGVKSGQRDGGFSSHAWGNPGETDAPLQVANRPGQASGMTCMWLTLPTTGRPISVR